MTIIWRDSMAIGHPIIDSQHKYLFCLVNAIELALQLDDSGEATGFYLGQLIDYTAEHFRDEERIQARIKYPQFHEHRTQHQQILEDLEELRTRLESLHAKTEAEAEKSEKANAEAAGDEEIADYDAAAPAQGEPSAEAKVSGLLDPRMQKEVIGFLRHWILDHVLTADIKLKPFLIAHLKGS